MAALAIVPLLSFLTIVYPAAGKAPLGELTMDFTEDAVVCKAEDVSPDFKLRLSVDPSDSVKLLLNKTKTMRNQLGTFDIESTLKREDFKSDCVFICSISSDFKKRLFFLKQYDEIQVPLHSDATLLCNFPPVTPLSFNLTWRLSHLDPILSVNVWGLGSRVEVEVWDHWKAHIIEGKSQWTLKLKNLTADHRGTYTCEVRTAEETYISKTHINVFPDTSRGYLLTVTLLAFVLCLTVGLMICVKYSVNQKGSSSTESILASMVDAIHKIKINKDEAPNSSDPERGEERKPDNQQETNGLLSDGRQETMSH